MDNTEITAILVKYNKALKEKYNILDSKLLKECLEEFSLNNFTSTHQCKALTWNDGNKRQCSAKATLGHFCKIHSKAENKECKHCRTHYKKHIRHRYRWECHGTIDIVNNESLEEYITRIFDSIEERDYDELEYDVLLNMITSKYTGIENETIRNVVDKYIEDRC